MVGRLRHPHQGLRKNLKESARSGARSDGWGAAASGRLPCGRGDVPGKERWAQRLHSLSRAPWVWSHCGGVADLLSATEKRGSRVAERGRACHGTTHSALTPVVFAQSRGPTSGSAAAPNVLPTKYGDLQWSPEDRHLHVSRRSAVETLSESLSHCGVSVWRLSSGFSTFGSFLEVINEYLILANTTVLTQRPGGGLRRRGGHGPCHWRIGAANLAAIGHSGTQSLAL